MSKPDRVYFLSSSSICVTELIRWPLHITFRIAAAGWLISCCSFKWHTYDDGGKMRLVLSSRLRNVQSGVILPSFTPIVVCLFSLALQQTCFWQVWPLFSSPAAKKVFSWEIGWLTSHTVAQDYKYWENSKLYFIVCCWEIRTN